MKSPRQEKEKNLIALSILLIGMFLGSLFVDITELFTGSGFSGRVAKTHNVLEGKDKTWVAFSDPKVTLEVVNDPQCATCSPDEALIWLRRVMPTLEVREVASKSPLGKAYIERFDITSLPALVFGESVSRTDFFTQAESLFTEAQGKYYFRMSELGLPAGKYLVQPSIEDNDITIGNKNAKVKVIEYSDFQCPYCKDFHQNLMKALAGKTNEVLYVFKNMPLAIHPQSQNAALASECAHEQGRFAAFSDYLFARQDEWGKTTGTQIFKNYSFRTGLNSQAFAICLDGKKHQAKLEKIRSEADSFGISGTPATFVNDTFLKGAVSRDVIDQTLKAALEN